MFEVPFGRLSVSMILGVAFGTVQTPEIVDSVRDVVQNPGLAGVSKMVPVWLHFAVLLGTLGQLFSPVAATWPRSWYPCELPGRGAGRAWSPLERTVAANGLRGLIFRSICVHFDTDLGHNLGPRGG